jgi:hypothetical protein
LPSLEVEVTTDVRFNFIERMFFIVASSLPPSLMPMIIMLPGSALSRSSLARHDTLFYTPDAVEADTGAAVGP